MAVATAVAGGGCLSRSQSDRAQLPPPPRAVQVDMWEYGYAHPPVIPGGRVVFAARNVGRLPHELTLTVLPEDFPPIGEQLRSAYRRPVPTIAILPPQPAGRSGTFAVDLAPGRYALLCFVKDPDGMLHGLKGMTSEFRVQ